MVDQRIANICAPQHRRSSIEASWMPVLRERYKHFRVSSRSIGSRLRATVERAAFRKWVVTHPGRPASDYYVAQKVRELESGRQRDALGTQRTSASSTADGAAAVDLLIGAGLKAEHMLVDYGCGSLRIGRHFIEFLGPGNYCGLDVTDRFYSEGLGSLDAILRAEKTPRLATIEPSILDQFRRSPPDFIVSFSVLPHVPPQEIDGYLETVTSLVGDRTQLFLTFVEAPRVIQLRATSWAYPADVIAAKIRKCQSNTTVEIGSAFPIFVKRKHGCAKATIRVCRNDAQARS
jgi:hypothetical protein